MFLTEPEITTIHSNPSNDELSGRQEPCPVAQRMQVLMMQKRSITRIRLFRSVLLRDQHLIDTLKVIRWYDSLESTL